MAVTEEVKRPTIDAKQFKSDVESGMTRNKLATKYGVKVSVVNKIAKQLEVKIKREVKPSYELINVE